MPKAKVDQAENIEALRDLIRDTQAACDKDGRALCSYFLELAAMALDDDSSDIDSLLQYKVDATASQNAQKVT